MKDSVRLGRPVSDLCRREGIDPANYYPSIRLGRTQDTAPGPRSSWRRARRGSPTICFRRNALRREIEELRRENGKLKELVADLLLELASVLISLL